MRPLRPTTAFTVLLALVALPAPAAEPVRLVYDTDICGDCDDVLALGMIHALQSRGQCQLLAVTVSADNPLASRFVDAVNTFYGRGQVPIGTVRDGVKLDSKYLPIVDRKEGEVFRFPHDLGAPEPPREAVALLRETLAAQPDGSVVIAQVGFSTNLARLLKSGPDAASPLSGVDLVRRKVRLLSIMAGSFRPIPGHDHFTEYNVNMEIPSAKILAELWPTPIVWSGFEIGIALEYPSDSILRDYAYVPHHPLAEAYIAYEPPPHNRPTWDLTSVLYAVWPDRGYFDLSGPGRVAVEEDGFTRFTAAPAGAPAAEARDRYLILDPARRERILEALVQLSSQPPCEAGR